tara:strand:- start:592 stop:1161 length:570 start_codon:yes stop_codon:yes gene_type:complete
MANLKKLVYQYRYLKLDLDELKEDHILLTVEFEEEFKDIISESKKEFGDESDVGTHKEPKSKNKTDERVKKIYKDTAKQLHPDKGGDEDDFKELNERYNENDLLGVIDFAVDNKIDVDISEDDMEMINSSVDTLKTKIEDYRNKLAYVWKYGTPYQRGQVLSTLGAHLGVPINPDDLSDEQKQKIGYDG